MSSSKVSPVLQFALLMAPLVMSGFYAVYSLVGLILDGRDMYNWSLEATSVAVWVGGTISGFSILVLLYARFKGLNRGHLLNISGWSHLILAIFLTLAVFVIVRP